MASDLAYIRGDSTDAFRRLQPDLRIVNLETSITASEDAWPNKGIHYRMHPANIPCLTAFGIDFCVLANNHIMDWSLKGLTETLDTLHQGRYRHGRCRAQCGRGRSPRGVRCARQGPCRMIFIAITLGAIFMLLRAYAQR